MPPHRPTWPELHVGGLKAIVCTCVCVHGSVPEWVCEKVVCVCESEHMCASMFQVCKKMPVAGSATQVPIQRSFVLEYWSHSGVESKNRTCACWSKPKPPNGSLWHFSSKESGGEASQRGRGGRAVLLGGGGGRAGGLTLPPAHQTAAGSAGPPLCLENPDQILGSWDLCFDFPCGLKSWEYVKEGGPHAGRWSGGCP